jgi:hypothetical protein
MLLTDVLLLTVGLAGTFTLGYALLRRGARARVLARYPEPLTALAAAFVFLIVMWLCVRSLGFGVDTVTYVELFDHYCSGGSLSDMERSFQAATLLLNVTMLWSCDTSLLPAAWIGALALPLCFLRVSARLRCYFACTFFLSLVGIELATNALRQGLSVGLMLVAMSIHATQAGARRWSGVPFAAAALLFHSSAILFLGAYLLAQLRWPLFLGVSCFLTWLTVYLMNVDVALPLVAEFLYEVQKYALHEADEIWIRALAFACVLVALLMPVLVRGVTAVRGWAGKGHHAVAARLTVLCIPFLTLPYFGYRFIYGVYPFILLLALTAPESRASGRQFVGILAGNLIVLVAWSAGSSYMREVPFL